jgi:hypothetical protein
MKFNEDYVRNYSNMRHGKEVLRRTWVFNVWQLCLLQDPNVLGYKAERTGKD